MNTIIMSMIISVLVMLITTSIVSITTTTIVTIMIDKYNSYSNINLITGIIMTIKMDTIINE